MFINIVNMARPLSPDNVATIPGFAHF